MTGRHAAGPVGLSGDEGPGAQDSNAAGAPADPAIRVVSGDPSAEELAAVTAVLAALVAEEAARAAAVVTPHVQSAWSESRRALRQPITPGPGQWGRHHG
ncbi:acyl-CoA carboxylase epsilon subunit [Frondihabitans australicus]|uniref:Acyl-CoA carboxylase epsilon subunit-like protein n=1 Tax=Frondihabitans australicus TaxID=386892 RepID=A0A495IDL7_9MICO|nr:acyl-CoA carboxylase epsilon subunit [Frondihabitans australicus]RKR73215.1 acyl-CoA carboxylase epsilon subunit-like protein [Frondihabitans australicus]